MSMTMTNKEKFEQQLASHYRRLFKEDPEYAYSAKRITPECMAQVMTEGLAADTANHGGAGIKATCKSLGIPHTRKAIRAFIVS